MGWNRSEQAKNKNAGACGIAGMNVANRLIEDNLIVGTGWQRMELSWKMEIDK
jgi:hypothetical protein